MIRTKNSEITSTMARTSGQVAAADRLDQQEAQPGPAEDALDDDRAAEQRPELQAEHGDGRNQAVAQRVAVVHGRPQLRPFARAVVM